MDSSNMASALTQMHQLATQASGASLKAAVAPEQAGSAGFGGELAASIRRINQLQQASNAKATAFQAGDPSVELNDLMVDMQKASVAFQMGLQVRNRLVTAYRDVMNMQV
ncbi:flagellar hook-basal body complex protein FliE [Halomonas dongshanensis]|uniref:Flagellar hook-basal body complex protein FliE n=1 Tax=Halomonas dongshanensis TaxID=2890835 RepID=A0ABT2EI22_9GAMM|nr:flagellar hook-basal body complex protein FliE [Halomonas dongshanensis]MCS2610249.1 flagellar hook-basal body complex protein FliE [Halomonas dongshanensis]